VYLPLAYSHGVHSLAGPATSAELNALAREALMNAIELLKHQHREVEELFSEYQSTQDFRLERKSAFFARIADALAAHTTLEEKIFYPGVKAARTEEVLMTSLEEHLAVKRLIAGMLEIPPTDQTFDAKLKVLEEQVIHHVESEEQELFPAVKKMVGEHHLYELGQRMEQLYEEIRDQEPRSNLASETDVARRLA
jgi:hemerythrin superfamily protein